MESATDDISLFPTFEYSSISSERETKNSPFLFIYTYIHTHTNMGRFEVRLRPAHYLNGPVRWAFGPTGRPTISLIRFIPDKSAELAISFRSLEGESHGLADRDQASGTEKGRSHRAVGGLLAGKIETSLRLQVQVSIWVRKLEFPGLPLLCRQ